LQFEEFSYVDNDGKIKPIGSENLKKLGTYLQQHYQVAELDEVVPYLLLWCYDAVPEPAKRPFMIAGLVGVWLVKDKDHYPVELLLGDPGLNNEELSVAEDLAQNLEMFAVPKIRTLTQLAASHFPDALSITYISDSVLVELPELSPDDYQKQLSELPSRFDHNNLKLKFHNGPLHIQEHERQKGPKPQKIDGEFDDTNYINIYGTFNPGAMLSAKTGNSITAGILVEKDNLTRLTVAMHCWEEELKTVPEKLGQPGYFVVKQGNWDTGAVVGHVTERIRDSDIGLATLNANFNNRFIDISGAAKKLLPTDDIKYGDQFLIDSFVAGKQKLAFHGVKLVFENSKENFLRGDSKLLPGPGKYVALVQGVFATSEPEIMGTPVIRDGVCGSAVVRLNKRSGKHKTKTTLSPAGAGAETEVMGVQAETEGEIAGFMHWSDLQT
jgi:hypothetical protein